MEQSLQARLIGATVLVAVVVILVPELLSGRRSAGEPASAAGAAGKRTYTIDLDGNRIGPATPAPSTAVPDAGGRRPGPVTPGGTVTGTGAASGTGPAAGGNAADTKAVDAATQAPSATATVVPAPSAAPAPSPAATPAAGVAAAPPGDGWLVQVGAFGSAAAARSLVQDLQASGLEARISPVSRGSQTLHRVRVGPVAARADADRLAARLKARGLPATVIAGD
jgi:DedD protein